MANVQSRLAFGEVTETDLAYFAGLFDGEGYARINVAEDGVRFRLTIANTYKPVLDWLTTVFGGKVYTTASRTRSHMLWTWQSDGQKLKWLLMAIQPYLKVKSDEVALVLQAVNYATLQKHPTKGHGHPQHYWDKFKRWEEELSYIRAAKLQDVPGLEHKEDP